MIRIRATVDIAAPREECFDLIRDVDLHAVAVPWLQARAISGRTTGYSGPGDQTEWSAKYFGLRCRVKLTVVGYEWPVILEEAGQSVLLSKFHHRYVLASLPGGLTRLQDTLTVALRRWPLANLLEKYLLQPPLSKALERRLLTIRECAEGNHGQLKVERALATSIDSASYA